jgi:hypothetical protein
MTEDADEWTERLLVATADDIDEWTEKLLVELKRVSTKNLAGERDAFVAMPSASGQSVNTPTGSILRCSDHTTSGLSRTSTN